MKEHGFEKHNRREREVFYVKKGQKNVEIIKNPTPGDYREQRDEFVRDHLGTMEGDPAWLRALRTQPAGRNTYDRYGNKYIWRADQGMHFEIEHLLPRENGPYDQNGYVPPSYDNLNWKELDLSDDEQVEETLGLASRVLSYCEKTDQETVDAAKRRHLERDAKEKNALRHSIDPDVQNRKAITRYRSLPRSNTKYWPKNSKESPEGQYAWKTVTVKDMKDICKEVSREYVEKRLSYVVNVAIPHFVTDKPNPDPEKENRVNTRKHSVEVIKRMLLLLPSKSNLKRLDKAVRNWENMHDDIVREEEKRGHSSYGYKKRASFYVRSQSLGFFFLGFVTWELPIWAGPYSKYSIMLATLPQDYSKFKPYDNDVALLVEGANPLILDV